MTWIVPSVRFYLEITNDKLLATLVIFILHGVSQGEDLGEGVCLMKTR